MEHIVTGCRDCPMFNIDEFCEYPQPAVHNIPIKWNTESDSGKDWFHITPDWCPLKKQPITIKLEEHE